MPYLISQRMLPTKKNFRPLVFFFLFPQLFFSQQNIRNHSLISGKKEVKVQSIAQDYNGYLWIGTEQGLVKYGGINYKLFQQKDGLGATSITSLFENKDSTLWIGHANGKITLFKNQNFSVFSLKDTADKSPITNIIRDKENNLWIATYGGGVYKYNGKKIIKYNKDNGLGDDYVYTLMEENGNIWMGTDAGITILNGQDKFKYITTKNGLADNIVRVITKDKNGQIWITTRDSGFCKYDIPNQKIIRPLIYGGWKFGSVNSMIIDYSGTFWIGTENNGLIKSSFDKADRVYYRYVHNSFTGSKISCAFEDIEKNIWIGTPIGLTQHFRSRFEFLTSKDGLPFDTIKGFLIDSKGNYWISSTKGLAKFWYNNDGKTETKNYFNAKEVDLQIVSLYEDRNGYIWLGTLGKGVYILNPETGTYTLFSEEQGLANNNVTSICDDEEGSLWMATLGGGVAKISFTGKDYKNLQIKNYSEEDSVGSIYVYYVFRDSRNRLWFGTDGGGLTKYENKKFTSYNSQTKHLKNDIVYSITEDKKENIWLNDQESGIYKFDGTSFTNFGTEDGIRDLSPDILTVGIDNDIVIVHGNGIDVLNEAESPKVRHYNIYEPEIDFNPNQNVFFRDKTGNVWIGTDNGLIRLHSKLDSLDYLTPKIQFAGLQVNGQAQSIAAQNIFDHRHNSFVFEFTGLYLKAPNKVHYKFKLDGHDNQWLPETESHTATYSTLPYGEYTFMVCASNEDGIWSQPISYHFKVNPPFWKTVWFYILSTILVIAAAYLYTKFSLKRLEVRNRILEEKVTARTYEVVEQKKILEEKNKDITDSISYAQRIQQAVLPRKHIIEQSLPNSFVFHKAKDIVSGDFYFFVKLDKHSIIAAVDCTGHGVPGAFMSMVGNSQLNQISRLKNITTPSEILEHLREGVIDALCPPGSTTESKDGMDIALVNLTFLSPEEGSGAKLQYAGAFNPLWLIRKNELTEIKGDKFPIGTYIGYESKRFTNHEIKLEKGDTFYIFSDGYADQFGGPSGKKFKYSSFKKLLLEIQHLDMSAQEKIIAKTIDDWKGDLEQIDDILVIGVRV